MSEQKCDQRSDRIRRRNRGTYVSDKHSQTTSKMKDGDNNKRDQRITLYARVSIQNLSQLSCFELQQKYYAEFKNRNSMLNKIYNPQMNAKSSAPQVTMPHQASEEERERRN